VQALGAVAQRVPIGAPAAYHTFREITYWEKEEVGYLSFDFYNGAMSTEQWPSSPDRRCC
jgi:putative two-component system hydrogenase maturation factor HypX/HoxX